MNVKYGECVIMQQGWHIDRLTGVKYCVDETV